MISTAIRGEIIAKREVPNSSFELSNPGTKI
jgi:hypothetical protein